MQATGPPLSGRQLMLQEAGDLNMAAAQEWQKDQEEMARQVQAAYRGMVQPGLFFDRDTAEANAREQLTGTQVPTEDPAMQDAARRLALGEHAGQMRQAATFADRGRAQAAAKAYPGAWRGRPEDFERLDDQGRPLNREGTPYEEVIADRRKARRARLSPALALGDPANELARRLGVQERAQGLRPDPQRNRLAAKQQLGLDMTPEDQIALMGPEAFAMKRSFDPDVRAASVFSAIGQAAASAGGAIPSLQDITRGLAGLTGAMTPGGLSLGQPGRRPGETPREYARRTRLDITAQNPEQSDEEVDEEMERRGLGPEVIEGSKTPVSRTPTKLSGVSGVVAGLGRGTIQAPNPSVLEPSDYIGHSNADSWWTPPSPWDPGNRPTLEDEYDRALTFGGMPEKHVERIEQMAEAGDPWAKQQVAERERHLDRIEARINQQMKGFQGWNRAKEGLKTALPGPWHANK
jgi:hypothetical protein